MNFISVILNNEDFDYARAGNVRADAVLLTLTDALFLFEEIDREVGPFATGPDFGIMERVLWAGKTSKITELITRLQWHKITLGLHLSILQS